jgi:hypothetical protein
MSEIVSNAGKIFTKTLSSTAAFTITPATSGVKAISFKYISGTTTIRGNVTTLNVTDVNDAPVALSDSVLTLSSTLDQLTVSFEGQETAQLTINASAAGVAGMICYL